MNLHYQAFPETAELPLPQGIVPVIIIPGLFGLTANWRSFAKKLSNNEVVIVLDQRNHGRSPHADSNSYADLVEDLAQYLDRHEIAQVKLVGHSMGGKVAMLFSLLYPHRINKMAVLDIAPVQYQHDPAPFLQQLIDTPIRHLNSRAEVERTLQPVITDTSKRLFVLQSLAGSKGDYHWRLNFPVLHDFMPQIRAFPDELIGNREFSRAVQFISGALSDYLLPEYEGIIRTHFPLAEFQRVEDAGHWLHVEQPDKVLNMLKQYLNQ